MRLESKVAIVTGAASGIGKEIAKTYVHAGARVAIADLNQRGADAVAAELGGPGRRSASPWTSPGKRTWMPAWRAPSRISARWTCW